MYGMQEVGDLGKDSSFLTKSSVNQNINTSFATCHLRFQNPNGITKIQGRVLNSVPKVLPEKVLFSLI